MHTKTGARRSVLIVDADPGSAEHLAAFIEQNGYTGQIAQGPEHALALIREPRDDGLPPPVALIELKLRTGSGLDLMPRLRVERPDLVCTLMSAQIDAASAVAALRRGAFDFFDRSGDPAALLSVLDRCFDQVRIRLARDAAYESLRLAKEEAEAASKAKSRFLATMSHELRTPLNAIIGFSEMMLREVLGALGSQQYRAYVADIHESGSHLLNLINDLLDLSKAEAGKLELIEDLFDLPDILRSVTQLVGGRLYESELSFAIDLPDGLPLLRGDERKTKQVLLNLLTNAVKFTPPGGSITLSGRVEAARGLWLTVADTGIGIPAEDIHRVLEAFEQVDSSFSRQHAGTGLGLPLVKAIMELHGGSFELESAVGSGTRATIFFPAQRLVYDSTAERARPAA